MTAAITPFEPHNIDEALKLSEILSKSTLLPEALRGKPGDVLVTLITGRELGLSPMQAIRGLYVVKGKAVMSADLQVAMVKRHPECSFFKLVSSDDKAATYETERKGEGKTAMTFTIQQAQQAGLSGGDNWRKYPAAMLRARCASALARAVYPDLTLGVYDPDEARDFAPERDVTPAKVVAMPTRTEAVRNHVAQIVSQTPTQAVDGHAQLRKSLIIDVPAGVSEEEAEARASEPPPPSDDDAPPISRDDVRELAAERGEEDDGINPADFKAPYGKGKGKTLPELDDNNLSWLHDAVKQNVDDPAKARWKANNEALLAAIEKEVSRR